MKTNPNMLATLKGKNFYPTLFTNTALNTDTNEPWWDGLDGDIPKNLIDWQGKPWQRGGETKAAHPNSRFTVSIYNSPTLSKEFDNPKGVPISAIILGGRRTQLIPLVVESFNWEHGVFLGARTGSETTAAAIHKEGVLRRDPMAMLPFCGYNMGEYFGHWLNIGKRLKHPPKIYTVNWFRTDENGKFIWPGFGDNIRILKWIVERAQQKVSAQDTALGRIPYLKDLSMEGSGVAQDNLEKLFEVTPAEWKNELSDIKKFLEQFGSRMPQEIWRHYSNLESFNNGSDDEYLDSIRYSDRGGA
jgi:phosphoenolpyruvate carboxykinase (GTP)